MGGRGSSLRTPAVSPVRAAEEPPPTSETPVMSDHPVSRHNTTQGDCRGGVAVPADCGHESQAIMRVGPVSYDDVACPCDGPAGLPAACPKLPRLHAIAAKLGMAERFACDSIHANGQASRSTAERALACTKNKHDCRRRCDADALG